MTITASLVKELREQTGAGMMECKKALEETKGDLEAAITIMRKSGQAKAAKKLGRVAAEGAIIIKVSDDAKKAFIVEVNCETDFAGRDSSFLEFANLIAAHGLKKQISTLDDFLASTLDDGLTISAALENIVAKIGENINVRRVALMVASDNGVISSYVHGNGRIGVLVGLSEPNEELGKDIAMHIAAIKPLATFPEEIPASVLDKEREIFLAQMQDSNKPPQILEKIIEGKIQKFISESVLIKQSFVKDPDITVENLLKQAKTEILGFVRYEVGEGIEKKESDFAAEVQAQVDSKK